MPFHQRVFQFSDQLAFHLAEDGGRDEIDVVEFYFDVADGEFRVTPLRQFGADVFEGFFGIFGDVFGALQGNADIF